MELKQCKNCGQIKSIEEFFKLNKSSEVRRYMCKECERICKREWRKSNSEAYKEKKALDGKIYREKHKTELSQKRKEYYERTDYNRVYYKKNRLKIMEATKQYYKENTTECVKRNKKWREKNHSKYLELKKKDFKKYITKYPLKHKAHKAMNIAIKNNILVKRNSCEICYSAKHVQGHHEDYSKPLDIIWLCSKCHCLLHKQYLLLTPQK